MIEYLKFEETSGTKRRRQVNGGQKLFFWTVIAGHAAGAGSPGSALVPTEFGWRLRQVCLPLHDIGFIFWFVSIVGTSTGTAAEPGPSDRWFADGDAGLGAAPPRALVPGRDG